MNPEVIRYIQQNRDAFSREVIDAALLAAGYSPGDIDEAWELVQASTAPILAAPTKERRRRSADLPPPPGSGDGLAASPAFWAALVGFVVLAVGLPIAILYVLVPRPNQPPNDAIAMAWLAFGSVHVVALLLGLLYRKRNRPMAVGLFFGLATTLLGVSVIAFFTFILTSFWGFYF